MTPDQYRREGADVMRAACIHAVNATASPIVGTPYSAGGRAFSDAIRAIDVDGVLVKVGGDIDRRDHLVNGPARLWMHEGSSAPWFVKPAGNSTEYVRADLVDELVRALEFYADRQYDGYDVNITDYGISLDTGTIIKDGGDTARAALAQKGGE